MNRPNAGQSPNKWSLASSHSPYMELVESKALTLAACMRIYAGGVKHMTCQQLAATNDKPARPTYSGPPTQAHTTPLLWFLIQYPVELLRKSELKEWVSWSVLTAKIPLRANGTIWSRKTHFRINSTRICSTARKTYHNSGSARSKVSETAVNFSDKTRLLRPNPATVQSSWSVIDLGKGLHKIFYICNSTTSNNFKSSSR
jgi:hypothetical protein